MKVGYARVSTDEQSLALQTIALERAGCSRIHSDQGISGAVTSRPGLAAAMAGLAPGDMLVVWRLDRLGRSLMHLIDLVDQLGRQNVQFQSLMESIDTSSSGGRLIFHVMAALAEFERSLISERTIAGMAAAKAAGRRMGRHPALTPSQIEQAEHAILADGQHLPTVARMFGVHPRTLQRHLHRAVQSRAWQAEQLPPPHG